jgi:hypothetical protein
VVKVAGFKFAFTFISFGPNLTTAIGLLSDDESMHLLVGARKGHLGLFSNSKLENCHIIRD